MHQDAKGIYIETIYTKEVRTIILVNKKTPKLQHFICFICGHSFNINHNQKKIQKYEKCSLNPNSEYYRYKDYEFKPVYTPPNKVMRIPERFFPDPIAYSNNQIGSKLFLNDFRWNLDNHTLCYMNGIGNTINMNFHNKYNNLYMNNNININNNSNNNIQNKYDFLE